MQMIFKSSFLNIIAILALLLLFACEQVSRNKRSSIAKDYGTISDIIEFAGSKSESKGMSVAGASSVNKCLGGSSLAADDETKVAAATAVDNMAKVLDQGLACAVDNKLEPTDLSSFFNLIVDYFALLPRTRLETVEAMKRFNEILVKYLSMLEDPEDITTILENTITNNLSSYNDSGAGVSYSDIAASISETAGAAFTAESINSTQAGNILSSLGEAAGNLATTAKEKPASGADVLVNMLTAFFSGVGSVTSTNFSDVSTMANNLTTEFSGSYGSSLSASDAATFASEANSDVSSMLADLVAAGKISQTDSTTLNASLQSSIGSGLNAYPAVSGASAAIASGSGSYSSGVVHLTLSAANATEVYISTSALCTGGEWIDYDPADTSVDYTFPVVQTSGTYSFYAKFRNAVFVESACVSTGSSVTLDRTTPSAPVLDISSQSFNADFSVTVSQNATTDANFDNYRYAFTAFEDDDDCTVGTATSGTIPITGTSDVSLYVVSCDLAGNISSSTSATYTYDGTAPTGTSISIAAAATYTTTSSVSLTLAATGADFMYVTNTAGCGSGGSWEAYATSKTGWTLAQTNATATVYAKFKDAAGNISGCTSDTITHDSTAPTYGTALSIEAGATHINTATVALTISATAADYMYVTNTAACGSGGSWEAYATSKTGWSLAQSNATATVYIKFKDNAGNETACASDTITHDSIAPPTPTLDISAQNFTAAFDVVASDSEGGVTLRSLTGGSTPTCSTGTAGATINISGTSNVTLNVIACDAALNASSAVTGTYTYTGAPSAAPSISSFTSLATTSLTINWADVSYETGYVIERAAYSGGCGAYSPIATSPAAANATSVGDTGLTAGTPYCYKVKASGSVSDSAYSAAGVVITKVVLTSVTPGITSNALLWNSVGDVTSYKVYYSTSSTTITTSDTLIDSVTPIYSHTGLVGGTTYYYAVMPYISGATYDVSATVSGVAQIGTAPTVQVDVAAGNYSSTQSVTLSTATQPSGCLIYYTTDNSTPTASSSSKACTGSAAISVSATATIKAYSVATNYADSSVQSFTYTIATDWVARAYIKASNTATNRQFNRIAIYGDTIVVGDPFEYSNVTTITNGTTSSADLSAARSGAAYVYKRTGVNWAQEAYIKPPNPNNDDAFGGAVAISGDTIVVGSYGESSNLTTITNGTTASTNNSSSGSGAAFVYKRSGTNWAQEAYIKAANPDTLAYFGWSVAISGDTIVVATYGESSNQTTITNGTTASANNTAGNSGAAYIYKRTGTTWAQEAYLKAPNAQSGDLFGSSAGISGDTVIVGAYGEDSNITTVTNGTTASSNNSTADSGAAYIFKRTGSNWAQEAYLKAPEIDAGDYYGKKVAIDGNTVVVAAPYEASNGTTITNGTTASANDSAYGAGALYVYVRSGSTWTQEAFLKAPNAEQSDLLGSSVSISGNIIVAGAIAEASNVSTITNGTTASSNNGASGSGAAYAFKRTGTAWAADAYIKAANVETNDSFGFNIDISSDTIVVSANGEDSNQTTITNGTTATADNTFDSVGAVYVYSK